jgi:hypothetical protein
MSRLSGPVMSAPGGGPGLGVAEGELDGVGVPKRSALGTSYRSRSA